MVMDVMAAADRIEAAVHVIHIGSGAARGTGAEDGDRGRAGRTGAGTDRLYPALGIPSLRARIAALSRRLWLRGRSGAHRRHHGIVGRVHSRFLAMFEPGDRVAVTVPASAVSAYLTALGCEPVLVETHGDTAMP